MCGISGFNFKDVELLELMNKRMSHRGPDFSGTYHSPEFSLGHVLLSIRGERSRSHQPVFEKHSDWVMVFNGEVYNTSEIKSLLRQEYQDENVDTFLIYGLVKKYGWDFVKYINGMYLIALYNKREGVVRLYRDPSGQKHSYYYHKNGKFLFSSEIYSLTSFNQIDKELDVESIEMSTILGYIPGNRTIFKHIRKIRVGEVLTFDLKENKLTLEVPQYFSDEFKNLNPNEVMTKNMRIHLQSHEQMAINLSGGMDSSSIFIEAMNQVKNINVYTTFFDLDNPVYRQDPMIAEQLAKDYGAKFTPLFFTHRDYIDNFVDAYSFVEEPNYNTALPLYLFVAKKEGAMGDKNRVVFSGDGGDELFGGYDYYKSKNSYIDKNINQYGSFIYNTVRCLKQGFWLDHNDFSQRYGMFKFFKTKYNKHPEKRHYRYLEDVSSHYKDYFLKKKGSIYNTMLQDRLFWLPAENFNRNDKLYMSQSIELRAPLSYHPLRTYFDAMLSKDEYMNMKTNKLFMRKIYSNLLPDYIVNREEKWGWHPPIKYWYNKESKNLFLDILSDFRSSDSFLNWNSVFDYVESSEEWPKKEVYIYLSLAILFKKFSIKA